MNFFFQVFVCLYELLKEPDQHFCINSAVWEIHNEYTEKFDGLAREWTQLYATTDPLIKK